MTPQEIQEAMRTNLAMMLVTSGFTVITDADGTPANQEFRHLDFLQNTPSADIMHLAAGGNLSARLFQRLPKDAYDNWQGGFTAGTVMDRASRSFLPGLEVVDSTLANRWSGSPEHPPFKDLETMVVGLGFQDVVHASHVS